MICPLLYQNCRLSHDAISALSTAHEETSKTSTSSMELAAEDATRLK